MAKSLQQVLNQIAKLELQAEALRQKEKVGVVQRIREAIAHYEITPDELFGAAGKSSSLRRRRATAQGAVKAATKTTNKKAVKKSAGVAKYTDGAGRTWSGHGKRPAWFKDALSAGKTAEAMLIQA